jgi:hypothetical protein
MMMMMMMMMMTRSVKKCRVYASVCVYALN